MKRRRILTLLGAASATVLTGCSSRGPPEFTLGEIEIQSRVPEPSQVAVAVTERDEGVVFLRTATVSRAYWDGDTFVAYGGVTLDPEITASGVYSVHVSVDDGSRDSLMLADYVDETDCLRVVPNIERDGGIQWEYATCVD